MCINDRDMSLGRGMILRRLTSLSPVREEITDGCQQQKSAGRDVTGIQSDKYVEHPLEYDTEQNEKKGQANTDLCFFSVIQ